MPEDYPTSDLDHLSACLTETGNKLLQARLEVRKAERDLARALDAERINQERYTEARRRLLDHVADLARDGTGSALAA